MQDKGKVLPDRMAREGSGKCLGTLLAGLFLLLAAGFTPLIPGGKNAAFPLISGTQKSDMFVNSAPVLVAECQNSDSGHEGNSSSRATSAQLLGRNSWSSQALSPLPSVSILPLYLPVTTSSPR